MHLIPLAEQLTEAEIAAKNRPADLPWNGWVSPEVKEADLALLRIEAVGEELFAALPEGPVGRITAGFLDGLGAECTFPDQFVQKLSPRLQAAVINERLDKTPPRPVSVVVEGERCVRFLPGNRHILPPAAVADRVYDHLAARYDGLEIEQATGADGEFWLRIVTGFQEGIPGAKLNVRADHPYLNREDVLAMGVQIHHEYRTGLEVSLYVRRLVCLNGLTADRHSYSWRVKEDRTEAAQLYWLDDTLEQLPVAFGRIMEHAAIMSNSKFAGHPRTALQEAAKAMKLPNRLMPALFAAYDQEPGDNHWALLNAVTRVASHENLAPGIQRDLWEISGNWVGGFDMCNARLPRPIAQKVGATILD